jgi:ubiquinone/menaquinone biosynthesis C-methylase UbiE
VSGVDVAPRMVAAARAKAASAGVTAEFVVGDAAAPPWAPGSFDVVLTRHVLWAMPDPDEALRHWIGLLRPGGLLLLIEDAGRPAAD